MASEFEMAEMLLSGTLRLECPDMTLVVCPSYHSTALTGRGSIWADERGRLWFKMTARFTGRPHAALLLTRPPGEAYDIDDHVMLIAIDESGREWRSHPMLVDLSQQIPNPEWSITHRLGNLLSHRERRGEPGSRVTVLIPKLGRLPYDSVTRNDMRPDGGVEWSLDHHVEEIEQATVTYRERGTDWLEVTALRNESFMPDWPGSLCQALSFALARQARPALTTRAFGASEHLGIHSGPFGPLPTHLPTPVPHHQPEHSQAFWELVAKFGAFVREHGTIAAPTCAEIEGIHGGAAGSMRTACLTLAVGTESLARILLGDLGLASRGAGDLDGLIEYVKAWTGGARLKRRAIGMLRQMAGPRTVDRLYEWAAAHQVSAALVDAWKAIRHPSAHGGRSDEDQLLYDKYYASAELFNRLVSWRIGYEGPIQLSSRRGWE